MTPPLYGLIILERRTDSCALAIASIQPTKEFFQDRHGCRSNVVQF